MERNAEPSQLDLLDLFGSEITYSVMCIACEKTCETHEEPLTKQLSFFVCDECRSEADDNATIS